MNSDNTSDILDKIFNDVNNTHVGLTKLKHEVDGILNNTPKQYKHLKTNNIYNYLYECINCTNAQDGQTMIVYERNGLVFCREKEEFNKKFELIQE